MPNIDIKVVKESSVENIRVNGRLLYGSDPAGSVQKKVDQIELGSETLYILASPLLGYGINALIDKLPESSVIFAWEANDRLRLHTVSPPTVLRSDKTIRYIYSTAATIIQALSDLNDCFNPCIRHVVSISINGGRLLSSDTYRQLQDSANAALRVYWRNRSTMLFMGSLWTKNVFKNLVYHSDEVDISSLPHFETVVVCGAGTSLENAFTFIRKNRARVGVFCADTALPALIHAGIMPDLVIALEAQIHNLQDFIGLDRQLPAIAADISSSPQVLKSMPFGKKYFFTSNFARTHLWEHLRSFSLLPSLIPPLGSVGVTALYITRFASPKQVFLCGLDFAGPPGFSHARKSPAPQRALRAWNRLTGNILDYLTLTTKTVTVQTTPSLLYSDPVLLSYYEQMRLLIRELSSQGIAVYDLRSSGLDLGAVRYDPGQQETVSPTSVSIPTARSHTFWDFGTKQIGLFLKFVQEKIENTLKLLQTHMALLANEGSSIPDQTEEILAQLRQLDYLFFDMPDTDWPHLRTDGINRSVIRLQGYRRLIDRFIAERKQ